MNILLNDLARKNKFPSLAIAATVHILMIGLALQTSTYIGPASKPVIELIPTPTKEKVKEEPKVIIEKELPKPLDPYVPFPMVQTENKTTETVSIKPNFQPETYQFTPVIHGNETVIKHTKPAPVFSSAKVNSSACAKPEYPSRSIRIGEEGAVRLAMLIDVNGRVLDSKVEKSSGSTTLDNAAISGLSLCQFEPATTDGIPEKSWAKLEYVWKID